MKIKHWQGYGCVNYTIKKKTKKELIVDVYGDHEWGVKNIYSEKEWLFDRIMKQFENIRSNELITTMETFINDGVEHCIYTFKPRFDMTFEELNARR